MTQFLIYRTQTGAQMRAAVRVAHRDGSFTVEPFFYQKDGKDTGTFQGGHKLRVDACYVVSSVSAKIAALIEQAKPQVAVVFNGSEPRLIGTLAEAPNARAVKGQVDAMLLGQRLSATYISIATCYDERFVAAHG